MGKYFANFDWPLLAALLALLILGLFVLASVAPDLLVPQALYALLGLILLFLFARFDYRVFEKIAILPYVASVLFLLSPFLFGSLTRGALRWIQIGGLTLQPSELAKPFLILSFAGFFSSSERLGVKRLVLGLLFLALPVLLIFWQPALGSSLVVIFSWLGIVLATGVSWRLLTTGFILALMSSPVVWKLLKAYQRERILSFFHPLGDPLGAGYHLIQATVAVGAGQWLGRGFGRGTQSHLKFLPERQTDFIFASLAEELGFLGGLILLSAFLLLLWRILSIAQRAKNPFGYLVCLGVFAMLFFQIVVNIGMNLGLLPITGVTLPLISYGGSSLVTVMISLGLVESIARLNRGIEGFEIK